MDDFFSSSSQLREKKFGSQETFIKPVFFRTTAFTLTFTFQPFHLIAPKCRWHIYLHLYQILAGSEKSAIPLTRHPWRHWATAGLRVNSSFLKAGIRRNPLLLLEGITILPSPPSAGCVRGSAEGYSEVSFLFSLTIITKSPVSGRWAVLHHVSGS